MLNNSTNSYFFIYRIGKRLLNNEWSIAAILPSVEQPSFQPPNSVRRVAPKRGVHRRDARLRRRHLRKMPQDGVGSLLVVLSNPLHRIAMQTPRSRPKRR